MLLHVVHAALDSHVADFGQHHRADGRDEACQAQDDLIRVLVQAGLMHVAQRADHHLGHLPVHADGDDRDGQHRAGLEVANSFLPRDGHKFHLAAQGQKAARTPDEGRKRPHEGVDPQILRLADKDEHRRCGDQLDRRVAQCDGLELVQTHQAPVHIDQAGDTHQRQVEGNLPFRARHESHIATPGEQRQSGDEELHFPDGGEGAVQGGLIVLCLGNGAGAVVLQAQQTHQAEGIADSPGIAVQAHAFGTYRAGQPGGRHQGQEHRKQAVGHVVKGVFAGTHGFISPIMRICLAISSADRVDVSSLRDCTFSYNGR